jgi:hypothetical protein
VPPVLAIGSRVPVSRGVDEFKRLTLGKLDGLRCPEHRRAPRVDFQGSTLQTITIRMSGCCDALIALANRKIAGR